MELNYNYLRKNVETVIEEIDENMAVKDFFEYVFKKWREGNGPVQIVKKEKEDEKPKMVLYFDSGYQKGWGKFYGRFCYDSEKGK